MQAIKKLLILSSGGDAPGMNTAIRAVVRTALHHNIAVFGAERGFCGLMTESLFPLPTESVANIITKGGTIIKTGRCPEFKEKTARDHCRQFLRTQGIDALIVLGGNGSFAGAQQLEAEGGPRVIGIPCTIDNDISGTEYSIGFDTARNTALEAIDKIRDTAFSLERHFIIEVMGHSSGFLAIDVGIAGGAELILIPEFPLTIEQITKKLQRHRHQKLASFIVAAEGGKPNSSIETAKIIKQHSGLEYKPCILGYLQRGGKPTVEDRKIASLMGVKSVEALLANHSQAMIAIQNGNLTITPLPNPQQAPRFFNDPELLKLNNIICGL